MFDDDEVTGVPAEDILRLSGGGETDFIPNIKQSVAFHGSGVKCNRFTI